MSEMISIAIHNGKREFVPLLENFFKSFLICNKYKNIEIILVESAGNQDVRDWFSSIDFDNNFKLFDGRETSIKKDKSVNIEKTLVFNDFDKDIPWYVCYMQSLKDCIKKSKGDYFVYLAEDNQFTTKGDTISDYISALKAFGYDRSIIHFNGQQLYKFFKKNNEFYDGIEVNDYKYYKIKNSKWCPFSICHKSIYDSIGELALSDEEDPHLTIRDYSKRFLEKGYSRYYPEIPAGVWFSNDDRDKIIKKINEKSKIDPDYVYVMIHDKKDISDSLKAMKWNRPISTDDFIKWIN